MHNIHSLSKYLIDDLNHFLSIIDMPFCVELPNLQEDSHLESCLMLFSL